jgi:hypothetical protein
VRWLCGHHHRIADDRRRARELGTRTHDLTHKSSSDFPALPGESNDLGYSSTPLENPKRAQTSLWNRNRNRNRPGAA